jgi:hypothetical protein
MAGEHDAAGMDRFDPYVERPIAMVGDEDDRGEVPGGDHPKGDRDEEGDGGSGDGARVATQPGPRPHG